MYNHYKHGNLSSKEQAIIRNESNLNKINKEDKNHKSSSEKVAGNIAIIKTIDRNILVAMGGVASLPSTALESFEAIWFNLKEKIEDISRNKSLNEKTRNLIIELMTSEAYRKEAPIESQEDIAGKLGSFSNTVNYYLD